MKKYLITDIRNGKEVSFKLMDGEINDVKLAISLHETRKENELSAWDYYEVRELNAFETAYKPVARFWASDFARLW